MIKGKVIIDFDNNFVKEEKEGITHQYALDSAEGFDAVAKAYLRAGWDNKYVYSFSWLGRPIIQLPDDMIRLQEIIFEVKPNIILETGIAHGGSLIYSASLLKMLNVKNPQVIGIDIEIRPHNKEAIEQHDMFDIITMYEGNSVEKKQIEKVTSTISENDTVIVFLDSCHSYEHVLAELNAYSSFVSIGSYIVAMDGIMKDLPGAPRTEEDWSWNNPTNAAIKFIEENDNFELVDPAIPFNEGNVTNKVTYFPGAYLRRIH